MTAVPSNLLEVHAYEGPGFRPLVDHAGWRVALLNHIDSLDAAHLTDMQRHDETDEVFVLLAGRCILFLGDGVEDAGRIHAVDLVPLTLYNVKRGTWHTHTLSRDASVLVIENRDTTLENSPFCQLTADQTAALVADARRLWRDGTP